MTFNFKLKTNMKFGIGISADTGNYIKEIGFEKAGVIIDKGVIDSDITAKLIAGLKDACIEYEIFRNDRAEPDYDYLNEYKKQFLGKGFDVLLGIGGGSTLDLAKGVATLLTNAGEAIQYRGFPKLNNAPLPVIAIPTTAGTGSEVTYNAVFTDTKEKKKLGINSEYNYPILAVLDPLFTVSCPRAVTVSSGMDALTHTLESFVHKDHTPLSRIFSKEAFRLLFNNLMVVLDRPTDIAIRAQLLLGSYIAGIALINAGSGPAGALSYPLGVHYKVPHGMAGAMFLTSIVEYNISGGYMDYSGLYDLIDGTKKDISVQEKNKMFLQHMKKLDSKMGMPKGLESFGLKEKDIIFMINQYDVLKKAIEQNPISITKEDLAGVLNKLS